MKRTIAGMLAAAVTAGALLGFAGTSNAAETVLVPGTQVNVCVFAQFEDLVSLRAKLDAALGNVNTQATDLGSRDLDVDELSLGELLNLNVLASLTTKDLNLLGLSPTERRADAQLVADRLESLRDIDFVALQSNCGTEPVDPPVDPPATTTPVPTTVPPVVVVPDDDTTTVVPAPTLPSSNSSNFTVPSGSVDTGGA